jgi:hypothetical protein
MMKHLKKQAQKKAAARGRAVAAATGTKIP